MAGSTNGSGPKLPTIEELRRAYEEGLPQRLLSGIEVKMRPVQADKLLMSGKVPDILTPLVMNMLFPPKQAEPGPETFPDEIGDYIAKPRDDTKEALEFIRSVDVVCEAALIDPTIVPYLSLGDRLWIFRLAFYPAEVLSTFRLEPTPNVGLTPDEPGDAHATEPDIALDSHTGHAEPIHDISVR